MVTVVGHPKYAKRHLELKEMRLGQWVSYRGIQYKVAALSMLLDDPYVHLCPPDLDWDKTIEVYGRDIALIYPCKVHPKDD
jgi:hypothetical protein